MCDLSRVNVDVQVHIAASHRKGGMIRLPALIPSMTGACLHLYVRADRIVSSTILMQLASFISISIMTL